MVQDRATKSKVEPRRSKKRKKDAKRDDNGAKWSQEGRTLSQNEAIWALDGGTLAEIGPSRIHWSSFEGPSWISPARSLAAWRNARTSWDRRTRT